MGTQESGDIILVLCIKQIFTNDISDRAIKSSICNFNNIAQNFLWLKLLRNYWINSEKCKKYIFCNDTFFRVVQPNEIATAS